MMLSSVGAFTVHPSASRTRLPTTQLAMSQQKESFNGGVSAAASLVAASIIGFTSATAILPAPASAASTIPSKEQIQKLSGPEKEFYTLQHKFDVSTQSIATFAKNAKQAKADASSLIKATAESVKAVEKEQAKFAQAEDNFKMAMANKKEFTKAELKALKDQSGKSVCFIQHILCS